MRIPGGRASRLLFVAGATALFLLPLLPLTPAQSTSDPWWGPTDKAQPTKGFAVRIPVTVENTFDYTLADAYVAVEVDFRKALVSAGWTNETRGAEVGLRGFTIDLQSIRVVPYNRGFVTGPTSGPTTTPLPHLFYPALFEAPKFRAFDATRNPAGTILFQLESPLRPQEKRDFYIYANPIEFGATEPPQFDPIAKGALDSFLHGTTGTVVYGYEPNQPGQNHVINIANLAETANTIRVYTYELSSFVPVTSTQANPNPFTLPASGPVPASRDYFIRAGAAFKIEAEKPIRVSASGQGMAGGNSAEEGRGFIPGTSGAFADDTFVYDVPNGLSGNVLIVKAAGAGNVRVQSRVPDANTPCGGTETRTLTSASPTNVISAPCGRVFSDGGKFLLSLNSNGQSPDLPPEAFPLVQVPSITGSISGTEFYTFLMPDNGQMHLCPETNASLNILRTGTNQLLLPEGSLDSKLPPYVSTVGTYCEEIDVSRLASATALYDFYTVQGPGGSKPAAFRLLVGAGERTDPETGDNLTRPFLGPWGGLGAVDFDVYGRAGMFGHYNDTTVTIYEERGRADGTTYTVNRTTSLRRDQFSGVDLLQHPDRTGRYHIVASKPIAVVSLEPASYNQIDPSTNSETQQNIPYYYHFPGRPVMPKVNLGAAEFRGPLLDLRSPTKPESLQDFLTTGPGSPVSYRLDVHNLGRWVGGEDLPDTITLACSVPTGWKVDGCEKEVTLGSRSAERLNVVVTPSEDDVNVSRTILVEARSKAGGVPAQFKLNVHVEVRYGVGMWFDVEDGRKTIDPPIGLDPGETHSYSIVLKNTGSTSDSFVLTVEDPREGWEQELLLDGEPVSLVRLDGGESILLDFRVKAPNAETAPQNLVGIFAQSQSNALAADVVNTATRIRPKVDLELTLEPQTRLAAPEESVVFNISTRNKGNDVFTIFLEQDSILPKGWVAEMPLSEITLSPNDSTVLTLRVTPPDSARAGDLASVKIAAEVDTGGAGGRVPGDEISAIVVVRRVYNLTSPPLADAETLPGTTLRYVLPIANRGNGQVSLEILPGAVEALLVSPDGDETLVPDWKVTLDVPSLTLDLNESADLPLRIEVPAGARPGQYNISFSTRLSRETVQNLTVPVAVRELSRVEYDGLESLDLIPGRAVTLAYVARNTGNVEGSFDLRASAPTGWQANVTPARARLAPGESLPVRVTLNASKDVTDGDYIVRLESQSAGAAATPTDLRVDVARPQLYLDDVSATGDLKAGELILVTANVGNRGGIEADNVSVALVVDGRVVDRVLLSRIPVGTTSVATLSWVATQRGGDVKVVLDPDQEISVAARDEMESGVEFGSRLGIPAPGVLAILSILGALAFRPNTAGSRGARGVRGDEERVPAKSPRSPSPRGVPSSERDEQ